MIKRINISLHPLFILITSIYFLIFVTYGIQSLKDLLLNGYSSDNIVGIIISIITVCLAMYLILIRYRSVEIYKNKYVLRSLISSREIYFTEISSIKKVPLNFFNYRVGSLGVSGVISLTSNGGDTYNVSDLRNTLQIYLKDDEVLYISCDNPEEVLKYDIK